VKPLFNGKFARRATGLYFAALLPVFCFALASCPSTDDDEAVEAETGVKITGVSVKPSPGAVARGGYVDFTTTVSGLDFTVSPEGTELSERDQEVSWSVDGAAAATTGIDMRSDGGGRLIVSESETSEKLTVRAESAADKTKYGISEVAVGPGVATVDSVTVSPLESVVSPGGTHIFSAVVTGMNAPDPRVIWTIEEIPPKISTATLIKGDNNGNGILTVAPDETAQELTIRATSLLNGEKYRTAKVILNSESAVVDSVTVSPAAATLAPGGNLTFSAAVTGKNNPDTRVTWSVLETGRSDGTDITTEGKLIVAADETLTTLTVKAVSVLTPDKYDTANVTVTSNSGTITGVTVSPAKAGMSRGSNMTFIATVTGTGGYSRTVKWSVEESNKNAGTVISDAGVLTVAAGETLSTLTVKAASAVDTTKYGTATVTVSGGNTPDYYSVTFNAGGGTPVPAVQSIASGGTVSQPADPARDGWTFGGWYKDSAFTIAWNFAADTVTENITLYAKWTAITYNIIYNGNGSTGGAVPASQTKTYGTPLTLQTNSGSLVKTGYTFAGWNTNADGTGTTCAAGAVLYTDLSTQAGAVVTLYAKWTVDPVYNITYNGNGSTGGTVPPDQTKTIGTPLTLRKNTGNLVKTDYGLAGWNTKADGSGTTYIAGGTLNTELSDQAGSTVVLYASWVSPGSVTYTVSYDGNGSTGGAVPASQAKTMGTPLTLRTNTGNLVKTGYVFDGWNTKADGTGTAYAAGASLNTDLSSTAGATVTLYAHWVADTTQYTVTFDKQGGEGGADSVMVSYGSPMPSVTAPSRTGYTFGGYYTAAAGGGTQYYTGAGTSALNCDFAENITLYAKWTAVAYSITYNANGGSGDLTPTSYTIESAAITLPAPAREGYAFSGWYDNSDFTGSAVITIPQGSTGDKTFWASWILIQVIGIDLSNPPASGITGDRWDYANGVYTIKAGVEVEVTGTTASDRVTAAGTATITLDDATINLSGGSASPIDMESGANITLKLRGRNTLSAAGSAAGIHVSTGGTLKITSANGDGQTTGVLIVSGGGSGGAGAGIGGSMNEPGGTITIAGGNTEAAGGDSAAGSWGGAAGIGGGGAADNTTGGGEAGTITISGGTVHATGHCGAGIGGGAYALNTTGRVTISGGEVSAYNSDTGAGIGGGEKGAGGIITVSGGTIYASGGAAGIGPGNGGSGGTFNGGAFPSDNPYTWP